MKFIAANDNLSNLWVCSKQDLDVNIISNSSQQITTEMAFNRKVSRITRVYAFTKYKNRRRLWLDLLQIFYPNIAWAVIGDFHCVMGAREKRGGRPPSAIACEEFVAFTNTANLIHICILMG